MVKSELFDDVQIAGLLGIEFATNGLEYLPTLYKIKSFRRSFEQDLKEELAKRERQRDEKMLDILEQISNDSVIKAIERSVDLKRLQTGAYSYVTTKAELKDDSVEVRATAEIFTGHRMSNRSRRDVAYVKSDLDPLKRIGFDSTDGLYLERDGYPRIRASHPSVGLPAKLAHSTHVLEIRYVVKTTAEIAQTIYGNHK